MSRAPAPLPPPPLSRPVEVAALTKAGETLSVEATAAERAALAALNDLPAVHRLVARLEALPRAGGVVVVTGRLQASVRQVCVATLEEFDHAVDEPVEARYAPGAPSQALDAAHDALANDPPEPIEDGRIDLGALVAEHLSLALDPYPRKPGAAFEAPPEEDAPHPFAALAALKRAPGEGA